MNNGCLDVNVFLIWVLMLVPVVFMFVFFMLMMMLFVLLFFMWMLMFLLMVMIMFLMIAVMLTLFFISGLSSFKLNLSFIMPVIMSAIMMLVQRRMKNSKHNKVDNQPNCSSKNHHWCINLFRVKHSIDSFIKQPDCQKPYKGDWSKSTNNFSSMIPMIEGQSRSFACNINSSYRNEKSRRIRQQMSRICHNCKTSSNYASKQFKHHKNKA